MLAWLLTRAGRETFASVVHVIYDIAAVEEDLEQKRNTKRRVYKHNIEEHQFTMADAALLGLLDDLQGDLESDMGHVEIKEHIGTCLKCRQSVLKADEACMVSFCLREIWGRASIEMAYGDSEIKYVEGRRAAKLL